MEYFNARKKKRIKVINIMRRKYLSTSILIAIFISTMAMNVVTVRGWTSSQELTSNTATYVPVVDGVKNNTVWLDERVNWTSHNLEPPQFNFYVQHTSDSLYVLIELKGFIATSSEEICSIYISSSNQTEDDDFIDKKQITLYNATEKGNETSEFKDLYLDDADYVEDEGDSKSFGAAKYGAEQDRIFEFNISRVAENATQNTNLTTSFNYAFKVGFTSGGNEKVTPPLLIQVGPKIGEDEEEIGEYNVNWVIFNKVVHWIVLVIMGIFGLMIIKNYSMVKNLKADADKYMEEN